MEEKISKEEGVNYFLIFVVLSVVAVIFTSFYNFYFKKNYSFMVEASCDSQKEVCFYRDCDTEDAECPPNNLSYYKKYTINAKDFPLCENEDCTNACSTGLIKCEETECVMQDVKDGLCVLPEIINYIHN